MVSPSSKMFPGLSRVTSFRAFKSGGKMIVASIALLSCTLYAASETSFEQNDKKLINQYIESLGYSHPIIFDSSNIKQFWIDKSVLSKDNNINILLSHSQSGFTSVPQKIKLANVHEAMDCTIDLITERSDISFSVKNEKDKEIAKSSANNDFITYKVFSATVHLEDVQNETLFLVFNSATKDYITIKDIVLSFSKNKNSQFLLSPGLLKVSKENVSIYNASFVDGQAFTLKGKSTQISSQKKILVQDNTLKLTGNIKNIGNISTRLYVGFVAYFKNGNQIKTENYPYKESGEVLKVISSQDGSNEIVVDSYQDWTKNCHIALNAEENMQDVPNANILDGTIDNFLKLDNGSGKIVLNKPLKKALAPGEKIRIHGSFSGAIYLYSKVLSPGEEVSLESDICKDDNSLKYSSKALPKGTYYVLPVLLSISTESNVESIISINDFAISY